jgi:hypothetical protein
MSSNLKLPASFTSLYRLFIRATPPAVLHHAAATRRLRRLYRPIFQEAALAIRKLEDQQNLSNGERRHLNDWLDEFDKRGECEVSFSEDGDAIMHVFTVDKTLSVLYNCSQSRGLPHDIVSRITSLPSYNHGTLRKKKHKWDPRLPPDSEKYQVKQSSLPIRARASKKQRQEETNERVKQHSLNALNCVMRMAEGREDLLLGRWPTTPRGFH